jgi:hypothetical protein
MRVGHSKTWVPHAKHVEYGKYAEKAVAEARTQVRRKEAVRGVGAHGLCEFAKGVVGRYFDYNTMVIVPIAHAALRGVVMDFLNKVIVIIKSNPPVFRGVMASMAVRASHLTSTCDQGRKYSDFVATLGYWTMEELLNFLEHSSLYVFDGVFVDKEDTPRYKLAFLGKMWYLLRTSLLYFLRRDPPVGIPEGRDGMVAAKRALHMYADMLERRGEFGLSELRYNLHMLMCVLPRQVIYRGFSPASMVELWIERGVQVYIKQPVAGRVTSNFGSAQAKAVLRKACCNYARFVCPDLADKVDNVLRDTVQLRHVDGGDEGDVATGDRLLGKGIPRSLMELAHVVDSLEALEKAIGLDNIDGWHAGDQVHAHVTMFLRALVRRREMVHSEAYGRTTSRESYHVLCAYDEGDGDGMQHYIACVKFFVKARMVDRPLLRFAVATLWPATLVEMGVYDSDSGNGYGQAWMVDMHDITAPKYVRAYAVTLGVMLCKCVKAQAPGDGVAYFLEYGNASGTGVFIRALNTTNVEEEESDSDADELDT